jgi:Leucine-rich repeat (LRR) protein
LSVLPALARFTILLSLDVSHNRLHTLGGVEALVNLKILRANENLLTSLQHVEQCTKLQELWFSENDVPWHELYALTVSMMLCTRISYE